MLLTLAGLQALIAMSPGPAGVLCIKTAAASGIRNGVALAAGLALGILVWALAALTGLSLLFEVAPYLQTALRLVGAVFLVWIGLSLWRGADAPMPAARAVRAGLARTVRLGIWTNLANPKALAYFAAVFTGLLPGDPTLADGALILALIFVIEFGWYATLALVFSRPVPRAAYGRAKAWLDRAFGAVVAALGIRIAIP
ncbi:LysE family transporter [Jannaschia sp. S6380]|uniref:LysE family translocator n=1 Tax=Jannaschia sp. S6380 TaxID=2926408 RepID=UPI001FF63B12|nr:LysE family transporter [Jannaschia sp. S6380]MCK0166527.1 LysE family transporter [Jannaschia sp. S6380]